jgi:6-phosphogluconolactonase (cycloisomerase 2 family)
MPKQNIARLAFNRGQVSPLALTRTDIERVELSAEEQTNFVPRVLGSMMLRPGWQYLGTTLSSNPAYFVPFIKSTDDTALLEFTNESLRVWVDDEVAQTESVSTTVRGGDFSEDITNFLKVDDPATTPGANANDVAFSPDGSLMFVTHDTTSNTILRAYAVSGTTLTAITAPVHAVASNGGGVAVSPNGDLITFGHPAVGQGYINTHAITGSGSSATFSSQLTDPTTTPTGTANGIAYSPDGNFLAVAHATTPFVTIYEISGEGAAATFTKLSDPATLPASTGNGIAFSNDSRFMAVAHDTSPYVTIYEINGTTFTKLSDPGTLPAGNGQSVAFSRDGNWLAVAHTTTPFVTIYAIDGTTFTKATNPGTLPDGNGRGVAFSSDNQFLAVSHDTSVYLSHYRNVAGVWTKQTDPATAPDGIGNRVAFSPNNQLMAVAHDTSTYLTVYQAYQWLDMDGTGASSTYTSGTFSTAFERTLATTSGVSLNGHTVRQIINENGGDITRDGDKIKITFQAAAAGTFTIDKCYIGYQGDSGGGDAWDFSSAPTQVTFSGGSAGFSIGTGSTITSDEIVFTASSATELVVSFHLVGAADDAACAASSEASLAVYYKTGDVASTVNVASMTTMSRDVFGVQKIEVFETSSGSTGLELVGTGYAEARRIQAVSVTNTDKTVAHSLRIEIAQGEVLFHVGTEFADDDLVTARYLTEGTYVFTFTPNSNLFFIELHAITKYTSIVSSVQIDAAGDITLPTPFTTTNIEDLRYWQSGDVLYLACKDVQQHKILRYGDTSWGIAKYQPADGPFRSVNTDLITLTASALTGDITLTASRELFKPTHVGALFRINSVGQATSDSFTAQNQFSDEIKVTGAGTTRNLTIVRANTWTATITLQRSVSEPGTWVDVATFTTNGTATYNDGLDNQIIYYRIGIKTGNYTSGTADIDMSYAAGTIAGIARITGYTSATVVDAIVLSPMGGTSAFENWYEGMWSDLREYPTAVAIYEGRLAWAGMDRVALSVSDSYESFDDAVEGDSGPIIRSIGEGPVDDINWLLPLQRLLLGAQGSERSCRSTSFDEPLTPDNFNMKPCSTQGSASVNAILIDSGGAFVDRTGTKLFQLIYNFDTYDYSASELTRLVPELCASGIEKIVVQRRPDTRIHCVLTDGTVALLVFEKEEDTICWVTIETDGTIEDAVVLPDTPEDAVYYVVNRTINGSTVRYLERWAIEDDCQGETLNKQADSFLEFTQASSATVTGLDHLEGESVVVWANGKCLRDTSDAIATFTVSSGSITLTNDGSSYSATTGIVGLPYTAQYKSSKLAYAAGMGTALNRRKRIEEIGLILRNAHHRGLLVGDSYSFLRGLPTAIRNTAVAEDTIHTDFDWDQQSYNTKWSPDSRLCLEARAPRPVTILAVTMQIETNG